MREVLVLRDLECIKAIAHPKRIDILKAFNNLPLSAKQLSQMLDEPHAKINYHIKTLYNVGILELVEEKIKSGIVEKYYYPKAKNIVIDKNVINFSLREDDDEAFLSKFDDIIELSLYRGDVRIDLSAHYGVGSTEQTGFFVLTFRVYRRCHIMSRQYFEHSFVFYW